MFERESSQAIMCMADAPVCNGRKILHLLGNGAVTTW